MLLSSSHLHFVFPWHNKSTIYKEAVRIELEVVLLSASPKEAVLSGAVMHETTGHREILCVQQYGLVTRTPL